MPNGPLQLVYDIQGVQARILDATGRELARGPVGTVLDIGLLRLTPQPPPNEDRTFGLVVYPTSDVLGEVQGRLAAESLESTNIVYVGYRGADPILTPRILNGATAALQSFGRDRVRDRAQRELDFIEQRLDSAMTLLQESSREIRSFNFCQVPGPISSFLDPPTNPLRFSDQCAIRFIETDYTLCEIEPVPNLVLSLFPRKERMPIYDKKLSLQVSSRMLGRLHEISEYEELSLSEFTRWVT